MLKLLLHSIEKDLIKNCKKEKSFIKKDCALKFQDIELEVLKVVNQFKTVELMSKFKNKPKEEAFSYIDSLLNSLKLYFRVFRIN